MEQIQIKNNQLVIADSFINTIKDLEKTKKQIEEQEKNMKQELLEVMKKHDIEKWETNDGTLKVNYIPSTFSKKFNSKKLKEEMPDIYAKYMEFGTKNGYVKVVTKEVSDE